MSGAAFVHRRFSHLRQRWVALEVKRVVLSLRRLCVNEAGGATVLGVTVILLLLLLAGVSIDISNAYRIRTQLQIAADIATHGAIVALAHGEDPDAVRDTVRKLVMMNLPNQDEDRLIADRVLDLQVLHYDPVSAQLSKVNRRNDSVANAVVLRLQRSESAGNAVRTYVLGMIGQDSWSVTTTSVAVLVPTRQCDNAEGLVAHGEITFTQPSRLGKDLCLHSQTAITLPRASNVARGLRLSLPSVDACKGICGAGYPDGPRPVALNIVMPKAAFNVQNMAAGFVDANVTLPEETAFFTTRPLIGDLEALREVGITDDVRDAGTVVQMTPLQFSQMREHPSGLVYNVICNTAAYPGRPEWETEITIIGREDGPVLKDLALVTDCSIRMDDMSRIEGALIIMTGGQDHPIKALEGAKLGDPKETCDPAARVRLMATGNLALPADLVRSNLSIVAGGDVIMEEERAGGIARHRGLVIHAGNGILFEGRHEIDRCPDSTDPLLAQMRIIAHVIPPLDAVLPKLQLELPKAVLPGKATKSMPGKAPDRPVLSGGAPAS